MTGHPTLLLVMTLLPSLGLGFVLACITVGPLRYRRGYERGKDEQRVIDGPALWRDPDALPVQLGTLPEHHRRMRRPMQYVEITDEPLAITATPPQREARQVTNLAYRKAQALIALDRVIAPLRTSSGRHRAEDMPHLYGTVAQRRPSSAEAQRQSHLAWTTSTAEWPKLALAQGWTVPDVPPTVEFGELVET